jgi:hypothetical protein
MARRYIVDEENARGSAFLKAQYTEAELTLLIGVGERLGIKLTDFFPYGVPAFDVVFEAGSRRTP